jgi:hypothetical protein
MEKSANKGSFITNGTMQNVLGSDLKIERVSRNKKEDKTFEKIPTVYDQIKIGAYQVKEGELSENQINIGAY